MTQADRPAPLRRHAPLIHVCLGVGPPLPDPLHSRMLFRAEGRAVEDGAPPYLDWSVRHPDGSRTLAVGERGASALPEIARVRLPPVLFRALRDQLARTLDGTVDGIAPFVPVGATGYVDWSFDNGDGLTLFAVGEHGVEAVGVLLTDEHLEALRDRLSRRIDADERGWWGRS